MMLPASATADAAAAPVVVEGGTPFQKRNAHILSAAEAGKSRWGSMEIERALGQAKPAAAAASVSAPPAASTAFDRRNAHVVASAIGIDPTAGIASYYTPMPSAVLA